MSEIETSKAATQKASAEAGGAEVRGSLLGVLGWAVPGLGHLLLKKFDCAAVFFISIVTMGVLGLAMGGKLYAPPFEHSHGLFVTLLHIMGFVGDMGAGVLFFVAQYHLELGQNYMDRAIGDYGTVFFLCAGLLNLLTALDAYDIAVGRKE